MELKKSTKKLKNKIMKNITLKKKNVDKCRKNCKPAQNMKKGNIENNRKVNQYLMQLGKLRS